MLFRKKNIVKDKLIKEFDPFSRSYYYIEITNGEKKHVNFKDLDKQSKEILALENEKIRLEDIEMRKRYDYLKSIGYVCDSFEYLGKVEGTISNPLSSYLNDLLEEKNVLIGIHRLRISNDNNIINDIFNNGLLIPSHLASASNSSKDLRNAVSYYSSNKTILKELMYADQYKSSEGSILIRIPDNKLEENTDIFLTNGNDLYLNPKYIIGYIPIYPNHHLEDIKFNPNYLEEKNTKQKN